MQEDNKTEFKSSFSDAVIESITAFANTKGGRVLVGINDQGKPVRNFVIGSESIQNWVNEVKNKTQPSIIPDVELIAVDGTDVVLFTVQEFPIKPVSFRGRYFKRVNNSNHQLSVVEISDMNLRSLQLSWDAYTAHGKSIADLDMEKVERFFRRVNEAGRFTVTGEPLANLEKLKFIKGETISNAALLLFGKESTGYNIHIGRFKTPTTIIDDKMLNGTLFEMVEETMRFITSWLKVAFEITGVTTQRTEIFEYPRTALREIVLTAVLAEVLSDATRIGSAGAHGAC